MSVILGLNAYHGDASACLVRQGELVAAAEEERFRRIKHWAGFPTQAIEYCLSAGGINLEDVDHIAVNRDPRANFWRKVGFTLRQRPSPALVLERVKNRNAWLSVDEELKKKFPRHRFSGTAHHVEHHLAHLESAFAVSPYRQAVAVSVDGFGDFSSAAWGLGRDSSLEVDGRVHFPHSLGVFYQALTQYLGFPNYGDEYKVMGLAPYGQPVFMREMREIVKLEPDGGFTLNLDYFRHDKENVEYTWNDCAPTTGTLYSHQLERLLGPGRQGDQPLTEHHKNIARSIQAMYEEAFFHLLNKLYERYRTDAVVLAGGCAMNSVANGKIYRNTPFKHTYIQAAAGDAGGAIGAAFSVWNNLNPSSARSFSMTHAYWGPEFNTEEIGETISQSRLRLEQERCSVELVSDEAQLCRRVAAAVSDGQVVGWFQGRMEWGPRALGNRSIVCDPRRADMKDILNLKIKRRESFRPFAPSILREYVSEWFETDDDVPFMMQVFQILANRRTEIPAVTHTDGSGRLQTVHRETNPRYYMLIDMFRDLTGVPMVLNTSFNENEPVVCRPEEALDCFLRTKMDLLVLGDYYISRSSS